jgi:GNAT superfamily N-acetyltransferase
MGDVMDDVEFRIDKDKPTIRISAFHEDVEVGYLLMDRDGGTVRVVCIEPEWRRHGVATALVNHAISNGLKPKYPDLSRLTLAGSRWIRTLGKNLKGPE